MSSEAGPNEALLTATFSFSLKSQQAFLFFLCQLFLTECHAENQAVKKKCVLVF